MFLEVLQTKIVKKAVSKSARSSALCIGKLRRKTFKYYYIKLLNDVGVVV